MVSSHIWITSSYLHSWYLKQKLSNTGLTRIKDCSNSQMLLTLTSFSKVPAYYKTEMRTIKRASAFISSNFSEYELIINASFICFNTLSASAAILLCKSSSEWLINSDTFCHPLKTLISSGRERWKRKANDQWPQS